MTTGTVSVLVVTWNSAATLDRCLGSLDSGAHEIIVVDNASQDGSAELVSARFPRVRLLRQRVNIGFAAAINAAARHARGDALLLLNPDAAATPGALERLAAFLAAHDDCGAAAGLLVGADGLPQRGFAVRRFPSLASCAVDLLLVDKLWPGNPISRRYLALDLPVDRPSDVEQPAAACLMVRRRAFDAVGGMDERFFPAWFEDVDLCRRLRHAGWRIVLVPDAPFQHQGGVAMRALGLRDFSQAWYANLRRYFEKHHGRASTVALRALIVTGMIARAAIALLAGRPREARTYLSVIPLAAAPRTKTTHQ
jgi:GT2 family glycosyltransferase